MDANHFEQTFSRKIQNSKQNQKYFFLPVIIIPCKIHWEINRNRIRNSV